MGDWKRKAMARGLASISLGKAPLMLDGIRSSVAPGHWGQPWVGLMQRLKCALVVRGEAVHLRL